MANGGEIATSSSNQSQLLIVTAVSFIGIAVGIINLVINMTGAK